MCWSALLDASRCCFFCVVRHCNHWCRVLCAGVRLQAAAQTGRVSNNLYCMFTVALRAFRFGAAAAAAARCLFSLPGLLLACWTKVLVHALAARASVKFDIFDMFKSCCVGCACVQSILRQARRLTVCCRLNQAGGRCVELLLWFHAAESEFVAAHYVRGHPLLRDDACDASFVRHVICLYLYSSCGVW